MTAGWSRHALAARQVQWSPHWPGSLACSHHWAARSWGRRREANCCLSLGWGSPGSLLVQGAGGNLLVQDRYNWVHCSLAVARGKISRLLRSPGDLPELPSSWEDRRAGRGEEDLPCPGDHWDHSSPGLAGTGPEMEGSRDTVLRVLQVLQAGDHRDLRKVHKVRGHRSQVAGPGSRGSRGRKEEPPGQEVQEAARDPCTCEAGVPCWAGRAPDRSPALANCSLLSVHFLQRRHWRDVEASRRFLLLTGRWPETSSGSWRIQSGTARVSAWGKVRAAVWAKLTVSHRRTLHSRDVHPHCRTVLLRQPPATEQQRQMDTSGMSRYLIRGLPRPWPIKNCPADWAKTTRYFSYRHLIKSLKILKENTTNFNYLVVM